MNASNQETSLFWTRSSALLASIMVMLQRIKVATWSDHGFEIINTRATFHSSLNAFFVLYLHTSVTKIDSSGPPRTHQHRHTPMQHIFTTALVAIALIAAAPASAQIKSASVQQQESVMVQEQRATSSTLKDLYGELDQQLRAVSKLSSTVDRIAAKRFVQIEEEIKAEITQVEAGLNRIRTADASTWPAMKSELETLSSTMRSSVDARTKGLKEAYGEK